MLPSHQGLCTDQHAAFDIELRLVEQTQLIAIDRFAKLAGQMQLLQRARIQIARIKLKSVRARLRVMHGSPRALDDLIGLDTVIWKNRDADAAGRDDLVIPYAERGRDCVPDALGDACCVITAADLAPQKRELRSSGTRKTRNAP